MNLTTTITHKLTFQVVYYESSEGGMNYKYFGDEVNELSEAVALWEFACNTTQRKDWIIECNVQRTVKGALN